jgi:hypothetical protein
MWLKFCRKNSSCGAALRHDALRRLPASRPERRGDHPPHRPLVGVPVPRPPRGDTAPVGLPILPREGCAGWQVDEDITLPLKLLDLDKNEHHF